jgi:hypothetical protein
MKKLIIISLILSILGCSSGVQQLNCSSCSHPEKVASEKTLAAIEEATVFVKGTCLDSEDDYRGSAVVYSPGIILTATHLLDKLFCSAAVMQGGKRLPIMSFVAVGDLSVALVPGLTGATISLSPQPKKWTHLYCAGYRVLYGDDGDAEHLSTRITTLNALDIVNDGDYYYEIGGNISGGDSGSGCWDSDGRLVGIVSFLIVGNDERYITRSRDIIPFLF